MIATLPWGLFRRVCCAINEMSFLIHKNAAVEAGFRNEIHSDRAWSVRLPVHTHTGSKRERQGGAERETESDTEIDKQRHLQSPTLMRAQINSECVDMHRPLLADSFPHTTPRHMHLCPPMEEHTAAA